MKIDFDLFYVILTAVYEDLILKNKQIPEIRVLLYLAIVDYYLTLLLIGKGVWVPDINSYTGLINQAEYIK